MSDSVTGGNVISTTLHFNKVWVGPSLWKMLLEHRFKTQHQLTLSSPGVVTGTLKIRIIPDTADNTLADSVDTGRTLEVVGDNSAMAVFPAVLRGIELEELVAFTPGDILTLVLSSTGDN